MGKVIGASMPVNFIGDLLLSSGGRARRLGAAQVCRATLPGCQCGRSWQSMVRHRLPEGWPWALDLVHRWSSADIQRGSGPRSKSRFSWGAKRGKRELKKKRKRKKTRAGWGAGGKRCKSCWLQVRDRTKSSTHVMSWPVRASAPGTHCHHIHTCPLPTTKKSPLFPTSCRSYLETEV